MMRRNIIQHMALAWMYLLQAIVYLLQLQYIDMDEEEMQGECKKPQIIEQEYPDNKNDIFQRFLDEENNIHFMDIEKIQKPIHYRSTKNLLSRRSDFRKILNSSSSNDRLFPTSIKNDSSRQNSERDRNHLQTENSVGSESIRKSFIKKFQESFSVSHTVRDSSSSFSERSDSKSSHNIIIPLVYKEEPQEAVQKKLGCNCKRSRCLKLYCECFQKQLFCSESCKCHSCGNHTANKQQHQQAVIDALARNAHGFIDQERQNLPETKGFNLGYEVQTVRKGCKCKKTKCLKKYCQCYQSGFQCTIFCRCQGCSNNKDFKGGPQNQEQATSQIKNT